MSRRELLTLASGQEELMQSPGFSPAVVQEASPKGHGVGAYSFSYESGSKEDLKTDPQLSRFLF